MEKNYEKPEIQVVRYRKQVKTNAEEFTDSAGVQRINWHCPDPDCQQIFFTSDKDYDGNSVEDAFDRHLQSVHGYEP